MGIFALNSPFDGSPLEPKPEGPFRIGVGSKLRFAYPSGLRGVFPLLLGVSIVLLRQFGIGVGASLHLYLTSFYLVIHRRGTNSYDGQLATFHRDVLPASKPKLYRSLRRRVLR